MIDFLNVFLVYSYIINKNLSEHKFVLVLVIYLQKTNF